MLFAGKYIKLFTIFILMPLIALYKKSACLLRYFSRTLQLNPFKWTISSSLICNIFCRRYKVLLNCILY